MLSVMNWKQEDFGRNWIFHTRSLDISYFLMGAADTKASEYLTKEGVPCFDNIDEAIATKGEEPGMARGRGRGRGSHLWCGVCVSRLCEGGWVLVCACACARGRACGCSEASLGSAVAAGRLPPLLRAPLARPLGFAGRRAEAPARPLGRP